MPEPTFEILYAALEESLKLYEEGARLVDQLRAILEKAELQVRTLQGRMDEDEFQLREVEAGYEVDE